ncbi:hypothetical protein NE237_006286 [Protea cynaroides]|uniref:RNase H type-1 domain-containing protein n=1 Tax=Protea cynaroides TaxID=273540 RepID=A0A9Q0KM88_9MAGN|nr:hypothetical protein NE237_006286 [Protea cynaroides]
MVNAIFFGSKDQQDYYNLNCSQPRKRGKFLDFDDLYIDSSIFFLSSSLSSSTSLSSSSSDLYQKLSNRSVGEIDSSSSLQEPRQETKKKMVEGLKLHQWLKIILSDPSTTVQQRKHIFSFAAFLRWHLWKARNEFYFNQKIICPSEFCHKTEGAWTEFLGVSEFHHSHRAAPVSTNGSVAWQRPPSGYFNLNVDASFNKDTTGGIGMVIREAYGSPIFAKLVNMIFSSVSVGEILALRAGVVEAVQLGITNLQVESDCLEIVNVNNGKANSGDTYVVAMGQDVQTLISDCAETKANGDSSLSGRSLDIKKEPRMEIPQNDQLKEKNRFQFMDSKLSSHQASYIVSLAGYVRPKRKPRI